MLIPKKVKHNRIKPKRAEKPTKAEQAHMDQARSYGCLLRSMGCSGAVEIHHILHMQGKRVRRDHRYVAPLCSHHHRSHEGIHGLGSEEAFRKMHDVDLVAWAVNAWEESN